MKQNTLRKHEIISNRKRISRILTEGKRFHGKLVSLYYLPSEKMAFAVLVRKSIGKAPTRNKIKRWIREIYRTEKIHLPSPCDIILVTHKPNSDIYFHNLKIEIKTLLKLVTENLS